MRTLITLFLLCATCVAYSDRLDEDEFQPTSWGLEDIPGSRSADGGVGKND